MVRRLGRDETGIAMGLAVVLIVVIGVMGAGLLVFVRNDLEAVVQVNQGQEAFEATDAGMQAAERQLLSDNCPESYGGPPAEQSDGEGNEDAGGCEPREDSEDWHDGEGKELDLGEREIDVRITYLPFPGEEGTSCEGEDVANSGCAPDESEGEEDERRFFLVESEGESASGNARRKVKGILYTYDLGVPKAYYSPSDITIAGNTCISNVSVFSLGEIDFSGNAGDCDGGGKIEGEDRAYGDWQNEYNTTARSSNDAGFAAVGGVEDPQDGRDYDDTTDPQFVVEPSEPQNSDEITFPFDYETQQGEQDEQRLNYFLDEALKQEEESNDGAHFQTGNSISDWPENSTDSTVVYVDASGVGAGGVTWNVSEGCDAPVKGTLVVDGASLKVAGQDAFSGVTIVRGGEFEEAEFESTGKSCWDGFVSADGEMKIAGTPDPFVSQEVQRRPGFYGVETWSWREVYE